MHLPFQVPVLFAGIGILLLSACSSEPKQLPPAQVPPPTTTQVVPASTPSDGNVKLNPAHGEPGHICEIPVGAPLDGSAAAAAPAPSTPAAVPPPTSLTLPPAPTTDGVTLPSGTPNPAHGQPGHRCEVNVGDPLP